MAKEQEPILAELSKLQREVATEVSMVQNADDLRDFWKRHTTIGLVNLIDICGSAENVANILEIIFGIVEKGCADGDLELLVRTFSDDEMRVNEAIQNARRAGMKIKTREMKMRMIKVYKYLQGYRVLFLTPGRNSKDGGKTWLVYSEEDIEWAKARLNRQHKVVCEKTMLDMIEKKKGRVAIEAYG